MLIAAGWMSIAASLLHLACIFIGPNGYRFLGAGEEMARAAERGAWFPTIITLVIANVLAVWATYAFSAAGLIMRLSFSRTTLVAITSVLLLRAMAYFVRDQWRPDLSQSFMLWSSLIVLMLGVCFAVGTWQKWTGLST